MGDLGDSSPADGGRLAPPVALSEDHDLDAFDCGVSDLNHWLRHQALPSEGWSARSYVVCTGLTVVGYYCLSAASERRSTLPRRTRHGNPDPTPAMLIGRLAVDRTFQGQGVGRGLLKHALQRSLMASNILGIRAILVHAIDDAAAGFYRKYGFIEFPPGTRTYFLPMETVGAGP